MKAFLLFFTLTLLQSLQPAFADDARHLFILSGQSNMTRTLSDSFKESVEQVFGKDKVIVVRFGHPGQPIKNWHEEWKPPEGMTDEKPENNGTLYGRLIKSVKKNIADKEIESVTFIWMQGEQDADSGWGSVYEKSFQGLLGQFKRDLSIKDINFVVGRINDYWLEKTDGELIRSIQQKLGDDNANGSWIDTDDLNRGVNPWGGYSFEDGHFSPAGYRVMGQRFAKKACLLIEPEMVLDPTVFEEIFFDSADDVKTHAAVGKLVTGSKSKQGGGEANLSALTDGRFAEPDHTAPGWVGFAPSEQKLEFVIDLGKTITIDTIALNTLLSSEAKAEFPNNIVFSTSEDGTAFKVQNKRYNTVKFYNPKKLRQLRSEGIKPQTLFILTDQKTPRYEVKASHIKITIETGDQWVFIDEIVVNPLGG
ncbi:MAG: sialate O-acetylesterase [Akkermansiaceae bacterium]